jgi:leader peptidase (prepilin peptidase)/N-methyltransferase
LLLAWALAFGAIWGSFFNVAIYRWPREMSVVRPASHCPHCNTPVALRHNVPVLGYLWLRGRTACCRQPLSPRYAIVEAVSAVLCAAIVRRFVIDAPDDALLLRSVLIAGVYFCFVGGLIIATFVDLEFMEIPDEVSLPGAALGLVSAVFRDQPGPEAALLGAGGGYLVIQLVFVWAYELLTGRRGMGEGDSKLLLMIGAFLGWQGALFAVFAGATQGLLTFVMTRVTELFAGRAGHEPAASAETAPTESDDELPAQYWGHKKLPFGPFLALGALEFLFFGEPLVDAWFRLVQGT